MFACYTSLEESAFTGDLGGCVMHEFFGELFSTRRWFRENGIAGEATFENVELVQTHIPSSPGFSGGTGFSYTISAVGINPRTGYQQTFRQSCPYKLLRMLIPGDRLIVYVHPKIPVSKYMIDFEQSIESPGIREQRGSIEISDLLGIWRFKRYPSSIAGNMTFEYGGKVTTQLDKVFLSDIFGGNIYQGTWMMNQNHTAISLIYTNTNCKIPGGGRVAAILENLSAPEYWEILMKKNNKYIILITPKRQTILEQI